jgi:hypothetical protein
MKRGFVTIIYDEGNEENLGYEKVSLSVDKEIVLFESGNFIKDWYNLNKTLANAKESFPVSFSSSVDHFIMDGAPYDSAYLHMIDDKPVLKYIDRSDPNWFLTDIDSGIEFFVPENTQPTWEELKKMCTDEKI